MNGVFKSLALSSLLFIILFISCKDDREFTPQIELGSHVTITNTLQASLLTNGLETPLENLLGLKPDSLKVSSLISDDVEFTTYPLGLYDIDMEENRISFNLVATADHPIFKSWFRVFESGTTDRYYLNFDSPQNVSFFSSNHSSVNLKIVSKNTYVVEIGEGFQFMPGSSFTIHLQ